MTDTMRERVARAMANRRYDGFAYSNGDRWDAIKGALRESYLADADAAIAAMHEYHEGDG